ncbi:uncharacterized protein, partial [Nicotiana tomentosiformis]|uniref:uncharacterized protein n=1 Tax=Nicotiana tomentosiformis TaxID=4098 RepID=UPI00388C6DF0
MTCERVSGVTFDKLVDIARHIEIVRSQERVEREAKRPRGLSDFSGVPSGGQFYRGWGCSYKHAHTGRPAYRGVSASHSSYSAHSRQSSFSTLPTHISHHTSPTQASIDIPIIDSVPVAQDFLDVFPADLPGMPPDRDIDFGIDFVQGTQPISIPLEHQYDDPHLLVLKDTVHHSDAKEFTIGDDRVIQMLGSYVCLMRREDVSGFVAALLVEAMKKDIVGFVARSLNCQQIGGDGTLRYQGRLCVPSVAGLREKIMIEIHQSRYSIHPGSTKMYHDVKEQYWWDNMKKSIAEFVAQCPNCQQVKIDGQAERTIQMLEDMLRACVLDFKGNWDDHLALIEFAYNNSYHSSIKMAPYEALYGRRCRSPVGWFEVGETELYGPDLIHQAIEKVKVIQERLRTAQSRQKSYSDVRRRDLEFKVGDWVFLKISPMKGVMRFGKKGKLSPRYIGPKCIGDPSRVIPIKDVQVTKDLSYDEVPVAILDRQVRKLRTKDVASVKVLWRNKNIEEMTWEAEEEMKSKYPY